MKITDFIKKIFREKTNNLFIQLFRYTFVGGFAYIIDFGTLYLLTMNDFFKRDIFYILAASIAFVLGLIANYILSILWVFQNRTVSDKKREFLLFASIGLIGLLMNALFIWFFTEYIFANLIVISGKQPRILIAKIISTVFVYFWNFFARKLTLFKD